MKTKYALYKYQTENIGDDIQSIAARQFLPQIDYYIDRDKIGEWRNPNSKEKVKLIANAWYMHKPWAWPPIEPTLDILPISMHINYKDAKVRAAYSSEQAKEYGEKLGEIGARDDGTKNFFESVGLKSYFSGCLTLTLQRDKNISKKDFILCVTVSDEVYKSIRQNTNRPVIRIDTGTFDIKLDTEQRLSLAEQFLFLYQSAHYVVTTRLHAALPSLALETPVLYIIDSGGATYDPDRLSGLKDFVNYTRENDFLSNIKDYKNVWESTRLNPKKYIKIRKSLIEKTEDFTNKKISSSFARNNDFSNYDFLNSEAFKSILLHNGNKFDDLHWRLSEDIREMKNKLNESQSKIDQLNAEIKALKTTRIAARKVLGNVKRKLTE